MRLGFPVCLLTNKDLGVFPTQFLLMLYSLQLPDMLFLGFCYIEIRGKVEEQKDKKLKE